MVLALYLAANNFIKHIQNMKNALVADADSLSLSETGRRRRARRRAARNPAVAALVAVTALSNPLQLCISMRSIPCVGPFCLGASDELQAVVHRIMRLFRRCFHPKKDQIHWACPCQTFLATIFFFG
jgi:hypothetical protein